LRRQLRKLLPRRAVLVFLGRNRNIRLKKLEFRLGPDLVILSSARGPQLSSRFDSRATHARILLPEALASVPFGFVLVRVRVRGGGLAAPKILSGIVVLAGAFRVFVDSTTEFR
jgi:hypothetical protein